MDSNQVANGLIYGADVSQRVDERHWEMLHKQRAVQFGIVRCYQNAQGGIPDAGAPATLHAALAVNLSIEGYHFPELSKAPIVQAREAIASLGSLAGQLRAYWIDVEKPALWAQCAPPQGAWQFISELRAELQMLLKPVPVGIYTHVDHWNEITNNTPFPSDCGLWLPHGPSTPPAPSPAPTWPAPTVVQFDYSHGNTPFNGVTFDGNYRPHGYAD